MQAMIGLRFPPSLSLPLSTYECMPWIVMIFSTCPGRRSCSYLQKEELLWGTPISTAAASLSLASLSDHNIHSHALNTDVTPLGAIPSWVFFSRAMVHIHLLICREQPEIRVNFHFLSRGLKNRTRNNECQQQTAWSRANTSRYICLGKHMHCPRTICSQARKMFIV